MDWNPGDAEMTKTNKLPVSTRALLARINRALRDQNRELRPTKGHKAREEFGDFYVVDTGKNQLVEWNIDLAKYALELGCLQPYERLDD
jgi:hypothetical protein